MEESRPLHWVASSKKDLIDCGDDVKSQIGFALRFAQDGGMHESAKPLQGFGGASVLEIVANAGGDTFRGVYTVKFSKAVYVLHVFMKKSKQGSKTPKHEIDLIKVRLKAAELHYNETYGEQLDAKK